MQQVHYKRSPRRISQQGVTLIEVLVSIVLMAIIGLGAAYISGRTAVLHRDQNIHLHTINQMRLQLENSAECGARAVGTHEVQITVAEQAIKLDCTVKSKTFTVTAKDGSNNPNNGVAAADVSVNYADIQVSEQDNSFVPVKVKISP